MLDEEALQPICEARDCAHTINDLKYNPQATVLAAACADRHVDLYAVGPKRYSRVARCAGASYLHMHPAECKEGRKVIICGNILSHIHIRFPLCKTPWLVCAWHERGTCIQVILHRFALWTGVLMARCYRVHVQPVSCCTGMPLLAGKRPNAKEMRNGPHGLVRLAFQLWASGVLKETLR